MNRTDILAERGLILEQKDRTKKNITVRLGKPYWVVEGREAACPVAIQGLYDNLADVHGVDLYQALELAVQLVNTLLVAAASKQQKLLWPSGERYEIASPKRKAATKRARKKTTKGRRTARKK